MPAPAAPESGAPGTNEGRHLALALGAALLIYLLFYWRRLFIAGLIPVDHDYLRFYYPSWWIGRRLLLEGGYLLWEPFRSFGQPFLANPSNEALYPVRVFSAILGVLNYQRIFIAAHAAIATAGGYFLGRSLGGSVRTGALGALLFGFNGFLGARAWYPADYAAAAWLPAVFACVDARRPRLLGGCLALQWLAGFPPFSILTGLGALVYAAARDGALARLATLARGALWALGLGAAQWIPFLEMFAQADRKLSLRPEAFLEHAVRPADFFRQLCLPAPLAGEARSLLETFYLGPVALVLCVAAVVIAARARSARGLILPGAATVAALLSWGDHLGFYSAIPGMSLFRFPGGWLLLATAFIALSALAAAARLGCRAGLAVAAIVAADLFTFSLPVRALWTDASFVEAPGPVLPGFEGARGRVFHTETIRVRSHAWRRDTIEDWALLKTIAAPSYGVTLGAREATGHGNLTSRRALKLWYRLDRSPLASPLFAAAGIGVVVAMTAEGAGFERPAPSDFGVVRLQRPALRAFVVDAASAAVVRRDSPGSVEVSAQGPGTLVVSEAWAPGWRATVNGERRPATLYEDCFLALDLPAGRHDVRFDYRPWTATAGAAVSLSTILLLILTRRRSKGRAP